MRMRTRTWLTLRVLVAALALAGAAAYVLHWPSGWPDVRLGLARDQVIDLAGTPDIESPGIEGSRWIAQRYLVRYELWIAFDRADRVAAFTIDRRIGTDTRFREDRLRGDIGQRPPRRHGAD